jgi:hypothetical protein
MAMFTSQESWSDTNIRYSIVTIKYKPDGTREWVDRYYEEPGYGGAPCEVDYYNGNIFVSGYYFSDSLSRIVTIKYNQSGVRQFVLNYDRGTITTIIPIRCLLMIQVIFILLGRAGNLLMTLERS